MPLLFVTSNEHKFLEIQSILHEFDAELTRKEMDFAESSSQELKDVALQKARQAFERFRVPLIVEDTGVYFEAYNNFPGTEPKRIFQALGFDGLLRLLKGTSKKAYFHTAICLIESFTQFHFFEAKWHGKISAKVIKPNANRMPYEKIFIPDGEKKAVVELSIAEKNKKSHRAIAARKLGHWLKERAIDDLIESI